MPTRILGRLRAQVRAGQYVIPFHAAEEMEDDDLSLSDLENIVLTGEIIQRQRDPETREQRYLLRGQTLSSTPGCCVVKFGSTGKVVFITLWAE